MDVWCFWAGIRKSSRDINDLILERSQDKAYLKTMWRYKIICELKLPEELKAEEHMKGKKGWKRERKLKRRLGRRRGK